MKTLINNIISIAAEEYNIPPEDITGWKRNQLSVMARGTSILIISQRTQLNNYELARYFNNRSHATIWNALKQARADLETNKAFRQTYQTINQRIDEEMPV